MLYMILLCSLDIIFPHKKINLIQLYKTIKQNGDHLSFYQYCVNALFSLVHLALIIMFFCKCNSFQVISDLLNSDNLKGAITQLCHEL